MSSMNDRVRVDPNATPDWSLKPSPTAGYSPHNQTSGANAAQPGFDPRGAGESAGAARTRAIDQVLSTVRNNGGEPADRG